MTCLRSGGISGENAIRFEGNSSLIAFHFSNDNFTRSQSFDITSAIVDCDAFNCAVIVTFSNFAECSETRMFWIIIGIIYSTEIRSTNFYGNTVSIGIIYSPDGGFPVRDCIFIDNSISTEFYGLSSLPFLISGCWFDDSPSGSNFWTAI
jgi:hypothetical protein